MTDDHVFGLARPGRDDASPPVCLCGRQRIVRGGPSARLIALDQRGVARARGCSHASSAGREKVVANHLHTFAERGHGGAKAVIIVLGDRILHRDDGEPADPALDQRDQRGGI